MGTKTGVAFLSVPLPGRHGLGQTAARRIATSTATSTSTTTRRPASTAAPSRGRTDEMTAVGTLTKPVAKPAPATMPRAHRPLAAVRPTLAPVRRVPPAAMAWGIAGLFFVLYCVMSLHRQDRALTAGYDLGIFEEEIGAYAHLHAPIVALKGAGFDILGDHFSPILALLAPLYRMLPDADTLLVAQAALMALACVPLTRWAHATRGPVAALVVGCGVGASWGIVKAVSFDFHEVAFAVPLLAFAVTALGQRRWRAAACWALPLILVKEDLGLTVAVIGLSIAWRGPRLLGVALAVTGVAASIVEILVILPAMNPHGVFAYLTQMPGTGASAGGTTDQLLHALTHVAWPPVKWMLLAMLALPSAFQGLRSPLTLLCVPTLAWRLLSNDPHYWGVSYHYSAVLMPVVFAGLIDALDPAKARLSRRAARRTLVVSAVFTAATIPAFPLHEVVMPGAWSTPHHIRVAERITALIPSGSTVAASNHLGGQLASRVRVSEICPMPGMTPAQPTWVVADRGDVSNHEVCPAAVLRAMLARYRVMGYVVITDQDGIVLLRRP